MCPVEICRAKSLYGAVHSCRYIQQISFPFEYRVLRNASRIARVRIACTIIIHIIIIMCTCVICMCVCVRVYVRVYTLITVINYGILRLNGNEICCIYNVYSGPCDVTDVPGQWMKVAKCISIFHLPKSKIILRLTVAFCDFTVPSQTKCATG